MVIALLGVWLAVQSAAASATYRYDSPATIVAAMHAALPAGATSTTSPASFRFDKQRGRSSPRVSVASVRLVSGFVLAAKGGRPSVADARLGRAVADDYRGGPNPIGDGSALDAARHTVRTGDLVGGSTHLEKAVEMRNRYGRLLRRGGLGSSDEVVARGRFDAYRDFAREHRLDEMMRARGLR